MSPSDEFRLKCRYYLSMPDTCPCCGYRNVEGEYDICFVCGWEDDYVQRRYPDSGGANHEATLRTAQALYARTGACNEARLKAQAVSPRRHEEYERNPLWRSLTELGDHIYVEADEYRRRCEYYLDMPEACPCCGYAGVLDPHRICAICGWWSGRREIIYPDATEPNWISLWEAQENFNRIGLHHPDPLRGPSGRGVRSGDRRHPCWRPLTELADHIIATDGIPDH